MNASLANQGRKLLPWIQSQININRTLHITAVCEKKTATRFKTTPDKTNGLTYETLNQCHHIAHRKSWNSFNTSNVTGGLRSSETSIEDMFIRRFILGTFHGLVCSEIIIKRQFNHIRVAFIMRRGLNPTKTYFLIGYTEELLAHWLQCPFTLELQTIANREQTIVMYV